MDLAYQRSAFAALDDRKKKAMLRSSKLKDEISLQGIGMANLSTRLILQEAGYHRCMHDINIMKAQVKIDSANIFKISIIFVNSSIVGKELC